MIEKGTKAWELKMKGQTQALIQVGGGIDARTAPLAAQAGAEVFVAASAIFGHPEGIATGIGAIRSALEAQEAPLIDENEA